MAKEARHHHFISQCCLKGFTEEGIITSKLICLDLIERRFFPTIPRNVGGERDFNRVEIEGLPSDALESALGKFDDLADKAIRHVENTSIFEGKERVIILNLMALFAVRNPARRKSWDYSQAHLAKVIMSVVTSVQEGVKINGVIITEEFKSAYKQHEQNIIFEVPRSKHIDLELHGIETVLPQLVERNWILVQAPNDATFLTGDFPVALLWSNPEEKGALPRGFGMKSTQVFFPLSKKYALVGDFEGKEGTLPASKNLVAAINSNLIQCAKRQIYTPQIDFYFMNPEGDVCYGIEEFWKYISK